MVFGDQENCLDPQENLKVYSPSFLVDTGSQTRLRLFANRENQEMEYAWRVVDAPKGASLTMVNARGVVKASTPYEYRYEDNSEASFTPEVAGEYRIEITVIAVGADVENGEVNATSSFIARLVAEGVASAGDSCAQENSRTPHLLLILIGLFVVAARRRVA